MSALSALRVLRRDPVYTISGIVALAIGLAAAIFAALYVQDELSYDRFIPGHDRIAVIATDLSAPGQAHMSMDYSPGLLAATVRDEAPGVVETARLAYDNVSVRRGEIEAREPAAWVDPGFFHLVRLPGIEGDPVTALASPDGAVITQGLARKYFGSDHVLSAAIQIDGGQWFQVRAVISDVPADSHLAGLGLFLSGRSAVSPLTRQDAKGFYNAVVDLKPQPKVRFIRERTYVRLAPAARLDTVNQRMARLSVANPQRLLLPAESKVRFSLVPLDRLHTYPFEGANLGAGDLHTDPASLADLGMLGLLILLLAAANFVNLATARSAGRAREVGVRKAAGATQWELMRQFLGETLVQVSIAAILAVSVLELSLPSLNALLMKDLRLDWRDPALIVSLLGAVTVLTALAGAYPALVLASFRPAQSLRGSGVLGGGSRAVRHGLVAFQFAVLMVLLLGATVVWLQAGFATTEGLRLDKDGVLVVHATPCRGLFEDQVRRLPGVRSAGCASQAMLGIEDFNPLVTDADIVMPGRKARVALGMADFDIFRTLGVRPLTGREFLSSRRATDEMTGRPGGRRGSVVLNETAMRRMGFSAPKDIVGRWVQAPVPGGARDDWAVIGVVPDFTLDLRSAAVKPTAYIMDLSYPMEQVLAVRLEGRRTPETLGSIDRLWKATGHAGAPRRQFLDDYIQRLYVVTVRQAALMSALCAVATLLACAGLLALSSYTAQRRTKEIGVRKAMGATAGDIVRILLMQFSRPIGLGVLVGAPLAYAAARRWLEGFTYHISLQPWMFVLAGAAALTVGLGAGLFHAVAVARARPSLALRYE
jgi:putative ABC transport system permease protein